MSQNSSVQSYSSEDEDAFLLTDKVEEKLLSTVVKLRAKDPSIYAIDHPIFDESDFNNVQTEGKKKKEQKFTYGDLLKQEVKQQEEENSESEESSNSDNLDKIKDSFKAKLNKQQDQNGDLFKVKQKHQTNKSSRDKNQNSLSVKLVNQLWGKSSQLDKTDQFLKNYILDKKWISSEHLNLDNQCKPDQAMIDEEDEQRSLEMDQYEAKYNFRFEEPGSDKIIQFPRSIPESIRIKPETRKQKRKRAEDKKKQQAKTLREKMESMKKSKKEQILSKINEMQKQQNIDEEQIDHDWFFCDDCAKPLNQQEQYYVCDECGEYMLCEECYDLIIHPHEMRKDAIPTGMGPPQQNVAEQALSKLKGCKQCRKKLPSYLPRYEYTDKSYMLNILCQKCYDTSNLETKKKFKIVKAQQHNFEQLLQQDPQKLKEITCQKDIEDLVDEYMKYDYEDVIGGGLKTKFKYVKVKPESYGLSDDQILYGDDKELNKYVSIKKLAPYQQDQMKLRNNLYKKKIGNIEKSAEDNKKMLKSATMRKIRITKKMKNRSELVRKRKDNLKKKLKIINLSDPQKEKDHFIPKSRLQSYGLSS